MNKITVEKALIEQAIDALENHQGNYKLSKAECKNKEEVEDALRAALAEPAVEPVAYWVPKAEQFCLAPKKGRPFAKAWEPLYTSPPPPAEVPLLTDDEIAEAGKLNVEGDRMLPYSFARAIEAAVLKKLGLK